MKMNLIAKAIMCVAGLLAIAALWMPWFSLMGLSVNGFTGDKLIWILFVVCGAAIIAMALIGKKWSAAVSILFSFIVGALGVKYYQDATSELSILGNVVQAGAGIYSLIAAGGLGIAGAIIKLFSRKSQPVVVVKERFGEGFGEYT